eukprot:6181737-Pleurochrysis_carterae.AAC.1
MPCAHLDTPFVTKSTGCMLASASVRSRRVHLERTGKMHGDATFPGRAVCHCLLKHCRAATKTLCRFLVVTMVANGSRSTLVLLTLATALAASLSSAPFLRPLFTSLPRPLRPLFLFQTPSFLAARLDARSNHSSSSLLRMLASFEQLGGLIVQATTPEHCCCA